MKKFEHLYPKQHFTKLRQIKDKHGISFEAYAELSELLNDAILKMNDYTTEVMREIYKPQIYGKQI
jgi:hypothetical protein